MAFKHFLTAALTLAMVCSQLVESTRDQYENRQDKPHAALPPSEATDSVLQVIASPRPRSSSGKETNTDAANTDRKKRAFVRWNGQTGELAGYESFTRWKPPVYQLSRPYFIPIYGASGRVPLFFPPQSLNINPGTPVDNPLPHPFTGPVYLPPTTSTERTSSMGIDNRFNSDDDDDDRPVWDDSPPAPATTQRSSNIIPTRPRRPPGMPDFPPLVHDVSNSGFNMLAAESPQPEAVVNAIPQRTTTTRRPVGPGPSNCVWAIVSCCSAVSNTVPDSCFEQRGCPGPFWGSSPCDSDYARAAIAQALNYYNE